MAYLGIRCSNQDFTYVILEGEKTLPRILKKGAIEYPKNYTKPQSLRWFLQELEKIIKENTVKTIAIKGTEGLAGRGQPFVERVEYESMVFLAAANSGIRKISKKVKSTIAKDLGLKGQGKYLKTKLNCSVFPDFDKNNEKTQEAILVAWSSIE